MKRNEYLLSIASIVTCLVILIGCTGSPLGTTTTPSAPAAAPSSPPVSQTSVPGAPSSPSISTAPPPNPQAPLVVLPSFSSLIDVVKQSVVAINTQSVVGGRFVQRTVSGAGSGWVIDGSGIIVTNNHVIEGATTISVVLNDGKSYTPTSVKADAANDLAILKIDAGQLQALKIADVSGLEVGDWVLAMGNALGQGISAKNGIVSRLGVDVELSPSETYNDLIETNAAINPGNSGGPLVNLSGEVVGITSLKLSSAGVEGMGYAINIKDALPIIQQLAK
jgi:serine protease Do